MHGLTSVAWRSLWARRARSLLTIGGIALGVGVLFASLATNDGIDRSIDRTVRDIVGRADLRVAAFTERGLSTNTLDQIRGTPGVAIAAPQIERRTYLAVPPGRGPATPPPVTVIGVDPDLDARLHDLPGIEALRTTGQPTALISQALAVDDGLGLGDLITVQGAGDPGVLSVAVSGVLPPGVSAVDPFGRTVVIAFDEARKVFGTRVGISRVDIGLAAGATADAVNAELEKRLSGEPYVLSNPADLAASLRASTIDFQATTSLLAAVALFVGAFLIFNTLSMTVTERLREVGLLRAAGATRRQVAGLVVLQAFGLGVAGSALGLVVGLVLAGVMVAYVQQIASVPLDGLSVPVFGVLLAVGMGLAVTIAAALEPAMRAGRVSPIEALRSRPNQAGAIGRASLRWLIVVFVVVGVAGIALWPRDAGVSAPVRSLAVYAILLAATLISPYALAILGPYAGIPFALFARAEERLARGAAVRDRSRSALTIGALTVGLAMIVAVGGVALNARRAASAWLVDVVPGDEVVTAIVPTAIDDSGPAPDLLAVPGVARVSPIATFSVAYQGIRLDAAAVVGRDLLADGRLVLLSGDRTSALSGLDDGGTVLVPGSVADRLGLRLGDSMRFAVGGGNTADMRIAGIVERGLPGRTGETVFVGWPDATDRLGVAGADSFAVRFAPGSATVARPALEAAARLLALEPASLEQIGGAITDALGQVFGLFDALAAVAVVVAALGIVNTLTMSVLERVREIGVLRATGMTRRQVWRMVVIEAGILGIVGAVLGCLAGLACGAVLIVLAGGTLGASGLEVPWLTVGLAAVFGIAIAMVAAYYPARLASGLSIVRAVQFE
jgi:putative ABC transport system permease protein